MSEERNTERDKQIEKTVNKGVIYGIAVTFVYIAYNYFTNPEEDYGVVRYLLVFAISSALITYLLIQFQKPESDE